MGETLAPCYDIGTYLIFIVSLCIIFLFVYNLLPFFLETPLQIQQKKTLLGKYFSGLSLCNAVKL